MRKAAAVAVVALSAFAVASMPSARRSPHAADAAGADQVAALARRLASDEYAERREAQRALTALGSRAAAAVRRELAAADDPEARVRLGQVLAELSRLPWRKDMASACREAQAAGKPIFVFSTIGEADGYS